MGNNFKGRVSFFPAASTLASKQLGIVTWEQQLMAMDTLDMLHRNESETNTTKGTEVLSWLHTERGFFTMVEVFFVLSILLHAVQVIFGWWRRCSGNTYLKYSLWLAYTASPSVVIYTFGLMRSASFWCDLFFMWTLFLLMALGSTNSMTAYSVDDNKQYMRHFIQQGLYVLMFLSILKIDVSKIATFKSFVKLVELLLYLLTISVNVGRIYASMSASSFLDKQTSNVEDHMKSEHEESTSYDPYLVCERIDSPEEITVSQIWLSNEGPFSSSDGEQLKKACLSYALFRLLRRRFFGIACPESRLQKTRDLVLKGFLVDVENNYEAAYRVIEAELAFTYDHFFTSSASFNTKLGRLIILHSIGKVCAYPLMAVFLIQLFIENNKKTRSSETLSVQLSLSEAILTAVIMLVLSTLELLQLYLYLSSDWARVQLARFYASGKDIQSGTYILYNKLPRILGYWKHKIGQHSLLKDLHDRSFLSDVMGSLSGRFFGLFEYHSVISRGIGHPGVKRPEHIQLTRDVKLAVARTLKASDGQLSNGAFSLQRNAQCRLLWACQQGNHVSTMLIWHVATEYCDIAQSCGKEVGGRSVSNRTIAGTLSNYCAYLMAFVPELLPDHQLSTRKLFNKVRHDALNMLSNERTLDAKYSRMKTVEMKLSDERVFMKGIRLGKQLKQVRHHTRWKILADFWSEMILYIAPSDNAKDHIDIWQMEGSF